VLVRRELETTPRSGVRTFVLLLCCWEDTLTCDLVELDGQVELVVVIVWLIRSCCLRNRAEELYVLYLYFPQIFTTCLHGSVCADVDTEFDMLGIKAVV